MLTMDELVRATAVDAERFEREHPYPFLVAASSSALAGLAPAGFQTIARDEDDLVESWRALEALLGSGRAPRPRGDLNGAFPVRKRPGNPFPERISLGRTRRSDICIPDARVSKLHAYFEVGEGGGPYQLLDARSRNGTLLNGLRLAPHTRAAVGPGDVIHIGEIELRVVSAVTLYACFARAVAPAPVPLQRAFDPEAAPRS